jgi:GTPase SAR1 family protein
MALRAKKPVVKNNRLKLFMYGNAKVGKTTLGVQFPNLILLIPKVRQIKKNMLILLIKLMGLF